MDIFSNLSLEIQLASWSDVVVSILVAFVLTLIISWVYRRTYRGFSFSVSFAHTLMILGMVTTLVMMVIGNSVARAFSLVGALSIIRFRTPVKDTRDTAFVFFALAVGMAAGTGSYVIAVLSTITISIIILVMHRFHIGEPRVSDFLLRFRLSTSPDGENVYQDIFSKYLGGSTLVNMTTVQQGTGMEFAFSVTFKDPHRQQQFLSELNSVSEIEQVMLMAVDQRGD